MATQSLQSPSALAENSAKFIKFLVPPVVCTAAVLTLWQILCLSPSSKLPGPAKVVQQTVEVVLNGFSEDGIWLQLFASLGRVGIGYALAAVIGVAIGVAIGVNKFLRDGFDPMIQVLRTVPPLAWLPLSLAMFQEAAPAGIFLIFITAIWPIVINTAVGIQQIPSDYTNVAKVLRLSPKDFLFSILIPSTVPYIFTGLRIGIGLAWLAIVAAEMLSTGAGGIGSYIWNEYSAQLEDSLSKIILAVICVGIVGLLLDRIVSWVGSLIISD
jgi:nitrate ABC transporter permease subunit